VVTPPPKPAIFVCPFFEELVCVCFSDAGPVVFTGDRVGYYLITGFFEEFKTEIVG